MNGITEIKNSHSEALELDQRIKVYANMAWSSLMESAKCLKQMRDTRLYTELGFERFEDYTLGSLNIKERQAYTYIKAYEDLGERFLQSNASLGITKLSLLSAVPAPDREELVENNDIAGMTVEEVKQLVRENDERGEQISMLTDERDSIKEERDGFAESLNGYEARIAELEKELAAEQSKPTEVAVQPMSDEEIKKIKEEAAAKAQKDADKKIKSTQKELEDKFKKEKEEAAKRARAEKEKALADYKQQLSETDSERAAAIERAERLEKQLKVSSNAETLKFQFFFEAVQSDFGKIVSSIEELKKSNAESAEKFRSAMVKYTDIMRNQLELL